MFFLPPSKFDGIEPKKSEKTKKTEKTEKTKRIKQTRIRPAFKGVCEMHANGIIVSHLLVASAFLTAVKVRWHRASEGEHIMS